MELPCLATEEEPGEAEQWIDTEPVALAADKRTGAQRAPGAAVV